MATPHLCPVCNGKGIVPKDFYKEFKLQTLQSNGETEECKTCKGSGIVWDYVNYEYYTPLTNDVKPYNPCDNCQVRLNPNWNGICHCALPYIVNPPIRW